MQPHSAGAEPITEGYSIALPPIFQLRSFLFGSFKLDGTETPAEKGGKTKAAWNGNKLDATFISKDGNAETITFSRDGAWLVMEGKSKDHGPMKFYFKKDAGKL